MKTTAVAVSVLTCLPGAALAASAFDGTWKTSLDHIQLSKKPLTYVLTGADYTCSSCAPPYTIRADGTDQKVSGHGGFDTESVAVVDAHTIRTTDKLHGKLVSTSTDTISADGRTDTVESTDHTGTQPSTVRVLLTRTADGPAGSMHYRAPGWKPGCCPWRDRATRRRSA